MARIRTLKPEILEDQLIARLSDSAFRLFVSSIVLADDFGNLQGDEKWLRSLIWWAHDDSPRVAEVLGELRRASLVTLYEVRGQVYLHLRGWSKHQRIDNAGKPRVPKPDDVDAREIVEEDSAPQESRGNPPRDSAKRGGSRLDLDPDHDHEGDLEGDAAAKRGRRKSKQSPLSDDWVPNEKHAARARELGVDVNLEAEKFRAHHQGKGTPFARPDAAFTGWLIRSTEFRRSSQRQGGAAGLLDWQLQRIREAEERERNGE